MERKSEHITKNKHRFSNEIYLRPWILKAVDVNKSCSDLLIIIRRKDAKRIKKVTFRPLKRFETLP